MAGVTFSHPNASVGTLNVRLAPKQVDWSYKLNTRTTPTYAGEVIQLLSVNFEKLIIVGQFGREGPWGVGIREDGRYAPRKRSDRTDYKGGTGPYTVGLTQMTEYFRRYFAVASQGRDAVAQGHYNEQPMRVSYSGALDVDVDDGLTEGDWKIYPTSFPSFRRSNVEFAPEWRIEGEIVEPDTTIERASVETEIDRLRSAVGFTHFNPFSDPYWSYHDLPKDLSRKELEALYKKARKEALVKAGRRLDHYVDLFPIETEAALDELLFTGGSQLHRGD